MFSLIENSRVTNSWSLYFHIRRKTYTNILSTETKGFMADYPFSHRDVFYFSTCYRASHVADRLVGTVNMPCCVIRVEQENK